VLQHVSNPHITWISSVCGAQMATLDKAEALLEELRAASWDAAVRDLAEVQAFARERGFEGELRQWDVSFWAERLREERYAITDEQLRPYFALPAVLEGLFAVSSLSADGLPRCAAGVLTSAGLSPSKTESKQGPVL